MPDCFRNKHDMILGNLSRVLLYLCLLTGAVFFVLQTFKEYSEYATSYTITQGHLSWSDLPTVVLCWNTKQRNRNTTQLENRKNAYGKNVSIDFRTFGLKENTITLLENKEVEAMKGLSIHLSELHMNPDFECHQPGIKPGKGDWQCYKITSTYSGHGAMDAQKFFATLAIKFKSDPITWYPFFNGKPDERIQQMIPGLLLFLMMSEENAYGLPAGQKFFDGLIEYDICKSLIFKSSGGLVKITKVSEYLHIPSTCSHDSCRDALPNTSLKSTLIIPFRT